MNDNSIKSLSPVGTELNAQASATTAKDPRLWKAVQDFKSILIYQMFSTMRQTIEESELTESAPGKDIFMSMFDEQVAIKMAYQKTDSLSETLYQQLAGRRQEMAPKPEVLKKSIVPKAQVLSQPKTSRATPGLEVLDRINQFQSIIQEAATKYQVEPSLISAVIAQESGGNPAVISSKGAKGLMQLMPTTAQEMGVQRIMHPRDNIFGGTKYLASLLARYQHNIPLALAAYNAGPTAVDKDHGIPPYAETQNYVQRVLSLYRALQDGQREIKLVKSERNNLDQQLF